MQDVLTLVGFKSVNFTGSDGKQVDGCNLYFTYSDNYTEGVATDKCFLGNRLASQVTYMPSVGSQFRIVYNKYGKVYDIHKV